MTQDLSKSIQDLDQHLKDQVEESSALRKEIKKEKLWRRLIVVAVLALAFQVVTNYRVIDEIKSCTTAGPRTPTKDDPRTGHKCYDEGQARTEAAVRQIVDANANNQVDSIEILAKLAELERNLPR